ncbi:uncharacterized domain 1-containing protein [Acinetobacter marinus]|uniref:Uncharacterized domain 1-containing protein n=1 Tax=Acinetobacter marinus TaxID=281375 RepID=A0A1G6HM63_9GAMM|nr:DUF4442 domain-containing protein [Acinetobacter marinus]SDB95349.1 uncharacterized domain 1-containing protein [Acinetobacter marinus]
MAKHNRLYKVVQATSKLPRALRTTIWSKTFGRIVPMVGTANIRYLEVSKEKVVVRIENHRNMQNHIKGVHAAAMALLAETATGFVTGLNVPDDRILLIKTLQVDYLKVASGGLTATATLSAEQQQFILDHEKGDLDIPIHVVDDAGQAPIQCKMVWAWLPKKKKSA